MSQESYSGRYFRTCKNDIKNSPGWFGKICLLGLISFIPIFGQMTLYGYAYEWAHQAAWGVNQPLPKKIYGRPGSKMLRWGWFALVISFVFALVPGLVQGLGSFISSLGAAEVITTVRGVMTTNGNPILLGIGGIINIIGGVGIIAAWFLSLAAIIRMTMYDRLGTGFQIGKVWAMARHDFGGLLRIFGMALLTNLIVGIILGIIASVVLGVVIGVTVMPLAMAYGSHGMSDAAALGYIMTGVFSALPILLVIIYVANVAQAWIQLLVSRAVGYWCKQFDVADWGTKDDPLPFQTVTAQQPTSAPVPPVTGEPAPAPAAGEPGPVPVAGDPGPVPASGEPAANTAAVVVEEVLAPEAEPEAVVADDVMSVIEVEEVVEGEAPETAAPANAEEPDATQE